MHGSGTISKKVKVILLENIDSLGRVGEVVTVAEGYARNFLFPQGKAALATQQEEKKVAERAAKEKAFAEEELSALQEKAAALDGTELVIAAARKEGEEIFGKITASEIAKQLNQKAGLSCKAKDIELGAPLTAFGSRDVVLRLSRDVEATIRVTVTPDPSGEHRSNEEK